MSLDMSAEADELMVGAYDLHTHSSPSPFPRAQDGIEMIRDAEKAGMAGLMLKSHYEPTAVRASLVNLYSGCRAKAYGGLVLNWPVGGLNIYAVENALQVGAKIIWMPTRDAANSLCFGNMDGDFFDRPGIRVTDTAGKLLDCVYDIMDAVKRAGAFLATGHISPEESLLLCREGRARGVNMILTHPEFPRTYLDASTQKELADLGVLVEKCWYNIAQGRVTVEEMADHIRTVGSGRCFMSTDRGQRGLPGAVSELKHFIQTMLEVGLTRQELRDMCQIVPKSIVMDQGNREF